MAAPSPRLVSALAAMHGFSVRARYAARERLVPKFKPRCIRKLPMHTQATGLVQRPPHQFEILPVFPASTPATKQAIYQPIQPGEFGSFEPYVDEFVIARFLQIEPRRVLEMVRAGQIPGHPIGRMRKTWRFRLSEIDAHFSMPKKQGRRDSEGVHGKIRLAQPEAFTGNHSGRQ